MTCVETLQRMYDHKREIRRPSDKLLLTTTAVYDAIEDVVPHEVEISDEYATLRYRYSERNAQVPAPTCFSRQRDRYRAFRRNDFWFAREVDALVARLRSAVA